MVCVPSVIPSGGRILSQQLGTIDPVAEDSKSSNRVTIGAHAVVTLPTESQWLTSGAVQLLLTQTKYSVLGVSPVMVPEVPVAVIELVASSTVVASGAVLVVL